jgi:hypothetical protein
MVGTLVSQIENPTVALNQMAPGSGLLDDLASSPDPGIPYILLTGNTAIIPAAARSDGKFPGLFARLLARLAPARFVQTVASPFFFGQPNDIAVAVTSMRSIAAGRTPPVDVRPVACDHLSYFNSEAGVKALAHAIGGG